jgi:hypothetical protein
MAKVNRAQAAAGVQFVEPWHYYTKAEGLNLDTETSKSCKKFTMHFSG